MNRATARIQQPEQSTFNPKFGYSEQRSSPIERQKTIKYHNMIPNASKGYQSPNTNWSKGKDAMAASRTAGTPVNAGQSSVSRAGTNRFCYNCGQKLVVGHKFCGGCGKQV
eukprot:TRINITY_DN22968_c0_g1_i1.p1 TRINITY_DN22968_c0_g1~~TRINITY_DN22968_c0_g1_i1.p1  ORF type:complete len:111 (+),score=13.09 TRINITY_DN22968_c0_g1_i1:130-462(+)